MSRSFLQRTNQGPIRAADSTEVLKRVEAYRLHQKQELDAAITIQTAYRDFRNLGSSAANNTQQPDAASASKAKGGQSTGKVRRILRRMRKRRSSKRTKKAQKDSVSDGDVAAAESKSEKTRREWLEAFRARQRAEKAAQRQARRELRRLELDADRAEREREETLFKLRQSLMKSTVYYHDLYHRTMHKVRSELVAAGHAAAATKMQSVWRMKRARQQVATAGAVQAMSEEDLELLEMIYGTRNILDVSIETIQADLEEAHAALTKIQSVVRGKISRDEVSLLRQKLRLDATGRSPRVIEGPDTFGADDHFMLMAMYDDDASNELDEKELRNFLADLNLHYSDDQIRELMTKMDRDGSGTVDFHELIQSLPAPIQQRIRASGYLVNSNSN